MDKLTLNVCITPDTGTVQEMSLQLPCESTIAQALAIAVTALPQIAAVIRSTSPEMIGVWGKVAPLTQVLQEGDRLEIYRPLTVDPKTARRERFARQGSRSAGLFKHQRPEAKAGY